MTASGTSGHGIELADYGDLGALGAVVVKSLSVRPWPGNPAPRVHEVGSGMLNSVGLQGPGLEAWLDARPAGPLGRRRSGGREHLGPISGRVRRRGRPPGAAPARRLIGGGSRGQRELPQRGGPLPHVRPLGHGDPRGAQCHRVRVAPLGQVEPERARHRRDRRGRPRAAAPKA